MLITAEADLGEVRATMEFENQFEAENARLGLWNPDQVHRASVEVVADTGSTMLVLPRSIVAQLGLRTLREVVGTYSDGRSFVLPVAGTVTVRYLDRRADVSCVVAEDGTTPLLGQIPLEEMDLLVDCKAQRLVGRDARGPGVRI